MATLQIIGAPLSNFVRVVRMLCHEKGVAYELEPARPHTPAVDAISPTGKIPVMRHGDVALCETRAICGYIDAVFPGPKLIPQQPVAAATCEQWMSLVTTTIDPILLRQYLIGYFFPGTPDGAPDRARIDAAVPKIGPVFAMLEKELSQHAYLGGGSFTLADIFLFPLVNFLPRAPESAALMAQSPHLQAWFEGVNARPSAVATVPPPMPGR
jgi:glutathione S-transferase